MIKIGKDNHIITMENTLNAYLIFATVARLGNISAASKELYISQPAISKSIANLEQTLGTTLFVRTSRGVRLTEEGRILYPQIEKGLNSIKLGEDQVKLMKRLGYGRLTIGVSNTLCRFVLLPILQRYVKSHPHVQISIESQSSVHTIHSLESSHIDIGLVGEPSSFDSEHMTFLPVMEAEDILVTTNSYLENLSRRRSADQHYKATLMLLDKDNMTRQYVEQYLQTGPLLSDQLIEVSSMDLLIEFAKIDLGIACVIENFVKKELADGSLIRYPMQTPIPKRKIGFIYSSQMNPNKTLQSFIEFISAIKD